MSNKNVINTKPLQFEDFKYLNCFELFRRSWLTCSALVTPNDSTEMKLCVSIKNHALFDDNIVIYYSFESRVEKK